MMHRLAVAAVMIIAVSICGVAYGAPSILGPTGGLMMPSAEVVGRGAVDVGAHFGDGDLPFVGDADVAVYKGTVGLSDRLEVTGAIVSVETPGIASPDARAVMSRQNGGGAINDDEFMVHAKYQLLSRPENGINVAVGALDIFEEALGDVVWYGAVSRTVGDDATGERLLRATAGLLLADDVGGAGDDKELFVSMEAELSDRLTGLTEYFGGDFSFGGRLRIANRLNVDVASVETDGNREFVFGAGYHLSW